MRHNLLHLLYSNVVPVFYVILYDLGKIELYLLSRIKKYTWQLRCSLGLGQVCPHSVYVLL